MAYQELIANFFTGTHPDKQRTNIYNANKLDSVETMVSDGAAYVCEFLSQWRSLPSLLTSVSVRVPAALSLYYVNSQNFLPF